MFSFPVDFFEFPLNLIMLALWLVLSFILWKNYRHSFVVRHLLSLRATFASIALLLVAMLWIGLSGQRHFVSSYIFVAILFYFQTVLLFVVMRGWRRVRFFLNHAGLLIAVASVFWGAPMTHTLRVQLFQDIPASEAFYMDGRKTWLPYQLELKDFEVQYFDNGVPSLYKADLSVSGEEVSLQVNKPYSRTLAEDVYLTSYNKTPQGETYCIIQIVREPWKYVTVAGILMMVAGALLMFLQGPRKNKEVKE